MSTLVLFFSLAIVMAVLLALMVIWPWLKPVKQSQNNQLLSLNIEIFKQRLAELNHDYQQQVINQATYDSQKLALERQLLALSEQHETCQFLPNWKSRLIFLVWIPVLSSMAYLMIENRTETYQLWASQDKFAQVADDLLTAKIDKPPTWAINDTSGLISTMQTNVHHHAFDAQRWLRLSEVFIALDAKDAALEALSRAYRLNSDDDTVALTYAQTSFFAQGGHLDAKAREAVEKILAKYPHHQGGQMLMAMGEMRANNFQQARFWIENLKTDIRQKSGDDSPALKSLAELEQNLDEREKQSQQSIEIKINIAPEILGQVQKGDSLFVSVRPLQGGMPVAVKKLSTNHLTKDGFLVTLSDNDSIMPTMKLSNAIQGEKPLAVVARISRLGDAMPQSGDLTSNPVPLQNNQRNFVILIDKFVP